MKLFDRRIRAVTAAASALLIGSCGGGYSSGPGGSPPAEVCPANTICMHFATSYSGTTEASFNPASLTVARGTVVTFTNNSSATHNIVFDTNPPVGGDIGPISGGSQTRTFSTVGTSTFHCAIHSTMTGQIIVQ